MAALEQEQLGISMTYTRIHTLQACQEATIRYLKESLDNIYVTS